MLPCSCGSFSANCTQGWWLNLTDASALIELACAEPCRVFKHNFPRFGGQTNYAAATRILTLLLILVTMIMTIAENDTHQMSVQNDRVVET